MLKRSKLTTIYCFFFVVVVFLVGFFSVKISRIAHGMWLFTDNKTEC